MYRIAKPPCELLAINSHVRAANEAERGQSSSLKRDGASPALVMETTDEKSPLIRHGYAPQG